MPQPETRGETQIAARRELRYHFREVAGPVQINHLDAERVREMATEHKSGSCFGNATLVVRNRNPQRLCCNALPALSPMACCARLIQQQGGHVVRGYVRVSHQGRRRPLQGRYTAWLDDAPGVLNQNTRGLPEGPSS